MWVVGIVGLLFFGLGAILMIACAVHAIMTVSGHKADKRTDRLIQAMAQSRAGS